MSKHFGISALSCRLRVSDTLGLREAKRLEVYSINSSARPDSGSGMAMPRALAAFALINNSSLVPCWTGRSAGFSPLRMRAT
jgi:hypothetical protein